MDLELFSSLLRNILHISVLSPAPGSGALGGFEAKFCYDPKLQPLFTAGNLSLLLEDMADGVLYEMEDELGVCLLFFRFAERPFLAGPFVRRECSEARLRRALIRNSVPASYIPSLRLYCGAFPVLSFTHARDTVTACMHAFAGAAEYASCRIDDAPYRDGRPQREYDKTMDYSSIFRRYDAENHFLRMIEAGDVENVLAAYREVSQTGITDTRYINAIYQDPAIGISMVRTLARKAAERGGVSPVEIHEITQRAVQNMSSARDYSSAKDGLAAMILELTEAVRRHRLTRDKYSAPIQKALEFIGLNYSQEISLPQLAKLTAFSEAHLSRTFKKEVGTTISQFICRLRCEEAAKLLSETAYPVQEIGAYVGYGDKAYFSRIFRSQYGMAPSAYREKQKR